MKRIITINEWKTFFKIIKESGTETLIEEPEVAPVEPKIKPTQDPNIKPDPAKKPFRPPKRDPKENPKPKALFTPLDIKISIDKVLEHLQEAMKHSVHPSISAKLKSKEHSLAKNPAFPDEKFDELIADERFQDILDKMQRFVHDKHEVESLQDLIVLTHEVYQKVQDIESEYTDELEKLAVDLICQEFGIEKGDIEFDAKLTKHGEISLQDIEDEIDEEDLEELANLDLEIEKRKFINSLIHGSAVKTTYAYHLISDGLNVIDKDLISMYSILSLMSEYGYWIVPDEMGGEESSVGKVKVDLSCDEPKVIAISTTFPFLIHELAKGVTEVLLSHDDLTSDQRQKVIKKADSLASERMALRLGPGFWERLNNTIFDSGYEKYRNNILAVLSSKPAKEFNSIMKDIMASKKEGIETIKQIVKNEIEN